MCFSRPLLLAIAGAAGLAATTLVNADETTGASAVTSQPLASPSAGGDTMFTALTPAETGIDFRIDIDPEHPRRRLYEIAFAGAGVALADYDGDGRPDVFMTHHSAPDRLYRQTGNLEFTDVTAAAGLVLDEEWSAGAAFADVNNDGQPDLYVCRYDAPNLLYVNNGDGTFSEQARAYGLDYRGASVMAAFADYDRDGDLDMYLLTSRLAANRELESRIVVTRERGPGGRSRPSVAAEARQYVDFIEKPGGGWEQIAAGQRDVLFRNDDGRFTPVEFRTADASGRRDADNHMGMGVVWWDYDADGWPDLYVANDLFGPDRLYRNNGDGTFTDVIREAVPSTPWYSMGVDFGDVNNDGRLDLLATDMAATTHYEAKVGMGEMDQQVWFLTSAEPRQYMRNALYLNSGTERFMEIAQLAGIASTDWTWSVKLNDFDNDGLTDAFVTNGMVRNFMDADTQREIRAAGAIEDYWDILATKPVKKDVNLAFRNAGDLRFERADDWGLGHRGLSFGAAVADLDRDGDLDIVVNNLDEPAAVYRNDSQDGGRVLVELAGRDSNRAGIGATVRIETASGAQVRYLSPTRGFMAFDEPLLHFGTGDARRINRLVVTWPGGAEQAFTNLAVGHRLRIEERAGRKAPRPGEKPRPLYEDVTRAIGLDYAHREVAFDDYALQPLLPARLSQLGPGVAWGDADGDGRDDVFIGGAAGEPGALFLAGERGSYELAPTGPWRAHARREDLGVLWLDADADGDRDLYVASGSVEFEAGDVDYGDRLYLNDGKGGFVAAPADSLPAANRSSSVVAAGDVDGDGDLDLFVGSRTTPGDYPHAPGSRLLRNAGGRFSDATGELAPGLADAGMVTGALWTDADDDGDPDLLLTVEWGPVRYFENTGGALREATTAAGLASLTGWWNGISSIDADNDGDLDYVVTNVGLNTKYHASPEKPAILYYGDFGLAGEPHLVEAKVHGDTELPVRGLSCSSAAMPFIGEQFGTFDAFARADVETLFTPSGVKAADRYEATELRHGILVNSGAAQFTFRPLPTLAQIAPGFGTVVGDFDLDGNADLYLVHNSFAPQPETGRMDGGLSVLLRGDGRGGFEAAWPHATGLVVPGDAKGLTMVDFDGDAHADFFVVRNDDRALALRRVPADGGRPLVLRLGGVPGNPDSAGARLTVTRARGSTQAFEVHAGAGYLSQSPPLVFLGQVTDDPIVEIRVRWPDGQVTVHQADARGVQRLAAPRTGGRVAGRGT